MNTAVVVGLGNPGAKYNGTRHNVGFAVADYILQCITRNRSQWIGRLSAVSDEGLEESIPADRELAASCLRGEYDLIGWSDQRGYLYASFALGPVSGFLVKPRTFMNLSGQPLRSFLSYRKLSLANVVVAHDEIDIPVGRLRVKKGGGDGGHNGLKSISLECGGKDFFRIRCGVGRPDRESGLPVGEQGVAGWVLGRYSAQEFESVQDMVVCAARATLVLISKGLSVAQNRFNS